MLDTLQLRPLGTALGTEALGVDLSRLCLLYTSPSPRDRG